MVGPEVGTGVDVPERTEDPEEQAEMARLTRQAEIQIDVRKFIGASMMLNGDYAILNRRCHSEGLERPELGNPGKCSTGVSSRMPRGLVRTKCQASVSPKRFAAASRPS